MFRNFVSGVVNLVIAKIKVYYSTSTITGVATACSSTVFNRPIRMT